jgi:hypothetical protein
MRQQHPFLAHKLSTLKLSLEGMAFEDKLPLAITTLNALLRSGTKLSRHYRHMKRRQLDKEIHSAPAYDTRIRDDVYYPDPITFTEAYKTSLMPSLPSKTKETVFQILNRTVWTNNKAYKSRLRDSPNCQRCGEIETMEHLLYQCENYAAPLWQELSKGLTSALRHHTGEFVARIDLTPKEIIFNMTIPAVKVYITDPAIRKSIIHVIQEQKRDIIQILRRD